jgi:putative Holliday junction resolvase
MAANLNMLALDVGERRVGMALANSVARLSSPYKTLLQSSSIAADINDVIEKEDINILVIGLPKNLNGEETAQTKSVREFSDQLRNSIDLPFYF